MNSLPSFSRFSPNRVFYIFLLLFTVVTCVVGFMPNGSDQFWNLANVDRVVHLDGQFKTNNIFPAGMPDDLNQLPRPWIQNRPVVYVVCLVAFLVRHAQLSWIISNLLFLLGTVVIMRRCLIRSGIQNQFLLPISLLLFLFPVNYYLVMQAFPEEFNQLLVMLLLSVLVFREGYAKPVMAALLTALLFCQRDSFVLLLWLLPLYFIATERTRGGLLKALLFLALGFGLYALKPYVLPSHTIKPLSALSVIAEVRPGVHNMVNYLYRDFPAHSFLEILRIVGIKAREAIKIQFRLDGATALFFYSMNLLMIPFLVLLWKFRRLQRIQQHTVLVTLVFVLVHIATIVLFENQYRFGTVLIPLQLICAAWYVQEFIVPKTAGRVVAGCLFFCSAAAVAISYLNIHESKADAREVQLFRELKQRRIHEQPVMIQWVETRKLLRSYAFLPNYCFFFPSDADMNEVQGQAGRLHTRFFLVKKDGAPYSYLKKFIRSEEPVGAKNLVLLELKDSSVTP